MSTIYAGCKGVKMMAGMKVGEWAGSTCARTDEYMRGFEDRIKIGLSRKFSGGVADRGRTEVRLGWMGQVLCLCETKKYM